MKQGYALTPIYHIAPIYIICDNCGLEQPVSIKVKSLNCNEGRLRTFCVYCKSKMSYTLKKFFEE